MNTISMEFRPSISTTALIIGAGPSGLAVAACLSSHRIPMVVLERDNTIAPLWRYRTYSRLHLHLSKQYSQLPFLPHPPSSPNYLSCSHFIRYLEDYVQAFELRQHLRLRHRVDSTEFNGADGQWRVTVIDLDSGEVEQYEAQFLVVATGENDEPVIPSNIIGLHQFDGVVVHSSRFQSGKAYQGLDVLVVGCGNSGMEIACDLAENGARAKIVVRSQLHLITKEIWSVALVLMKYMPNGLVDSIILFMCYLYFGNTSKYGLHRPSKGPLYLKNNTPTYPTIDAGTFAKIKSGEIEVLLAISSVKGKNVTFENGKQCTFDAIILATGYRSTVKKWLKGDDYLIGEDGMAKQRFPNHWKGKNGLYCSGLIRRGIYGSAQDAINIANDINDALHGSEKHNSK